MHAPNAALLIDFDNVTMGIRSDLGHELRNLLSSDIIKGKVAVQRAYADWRRYPQYIVPLTESSIDLIYAPAYGSSKKNATDIRLAIDALEIVFTRPEIGTYILLSGDSDFSSLVIKLKEYGKYVIGVGIRESSSDLLVMNCDEYYSYNALAGLVKAGEDEQVSRDPWELVVEAVARMKRNGDVMRSDRLKQVMQDIDSSFDEKNLGMAKFSRFCQEAAQRGLLKLTRLENGQMEVDVAAPDGAAPAAAPAKPDARNGALSEEKERRGRRGRGRRDRGRGGAERETPAATPELALSGEMPMIVTAPPPLVPAAPATVSIAAPAAGQMGGERLTREEALALVQQAVRALAGSEQDAVPASAVRQKARDLLGRDSETLNERFFHRILRDAHDANLIDLRKRGDDYEVALAVSAGPVAEQLSAAAPATDVPESQAARSASHAASLRRGIRPRGARPGRGGELPPELLSIGVVESARPAEPEPEPAAAAEPAPDFVVETAPPAPAKKATARKGRGTRATKKATAKKTAPAPALEPGAAATPKPRRPRGRRKTVAANEKSG
ncbi:MAG TPA: NYN domain-containing protein [Gemmatimonadaceae bacterium]|nr:NYN domain-containing protein [Gemmatimonadaceae bacterium]